MSCSLVVLEQNMHLKNYIFICRFPSDPLLCAEWISIVAKERGELYRPYENSTICSVHFAERDVTGNSQRRRLLKTAIPKLKVYKHV